MEIVCYRIIKVNYNLLGLLNLKVLINMLLSDILKNSSLLGLGHIPV